MMRFIYLCISFFLYLFLQPTSGFTQIIFQEDFESFPQNWNCTSSYRNGWGGFSCFYFSSRPGYVVDIGLGRNGGQALYVWRNYEVPNIYSSSDYPYPYWGAANGYQEIYHRWYMKIPSTFNKRIPDGMKWWRYRSTGTIHELYLNVIGETIATGYLALGHSYWDPPPAPNSAYLRLIPMTEILDGRWHCHELRIRWNTYGKYDGIVTYWLDGVQRASYGNFNLDRNGLGVAHYNRNIGVGIGNASDPPWDMKDWIAVVFDDIVVATKYIGPATAQTPSPPTGLKIVNY